MIGRRQFLSGVAGLAATSAALPGIARAASSAAAPGRPRALVHIFLRGGMDSVLTTDAKVRREYDPRCHLPYEESQIITSGNTRVAPLMAPFTKLLPRMAIVNGVKGFSVGHDSGEENIVEMRHVFPRISDPDSETRHGGFGLVGTLGKLRNGDAPLESIRFNWPWDPVPGRTLLMDRDAEARPEQAATEGVLPRLFRLAHDAPRRAALERVFAEQTKRYATNEGAKVPADCVRALLARMPDEALPPPQLIPTPDSAPSPRDLMAWSVILRDVLYVLKHRLCPSIFIFAPYAYAGGGWDSHAWNQRWQTTAFKYFAPALQFLMAELDRTRAGDGTVLSDEVGVLVSSELGRFPILNEYEGKDHLPELPFMFMGPGVKPGQYGQTDHRLIAQPVSARTGKMSSSPKDFVPDIDDIGTTVLNWFGIEDAASVGYLGRRLDFLLA